MKRSLIRAACVLLILSLLPLGALAETSGQAAWEYAAVLLDGRAEVDAALLSDGQDNTDYGFRRGQAGVLTVNLPEGAQATSFLGLTSGGRALIANGETVYSVSLPQ